MTRYNGWSLDLITGKFHIIGDEEAAGRELATAAFKAVYGDCDYACAYVEPFGWAPEDGCPVHDKELEPKPCTCERRNCVKCFIQGEEIGNSTDRR